MKNHKKLLEALKKDFESTHKSTKNQDSSSFKYYHVETPDFITIIEDQLLRLYSAVFFGEYPGSIPSESIENKVAKSYKTLIWLFHCLSLSKGVSYKEAHLGDWLVRGLNRLQNVSTDKYLVSFILFKCGRQLELISSTPPYNVYRNQTLVRELGFFLGCLAATIKVNIELLIKLIDTEVHSSSRKRAKRSSNTDERLEHMRDIRKNILLRQNTAILEVLGSNEKGTLGRFCQALGGLDVDVIAGCSITDTFKGDPAMRYICHLQLPDTMDVHEMLNELNKKAYVRDYLFKDPIPSALASTREDWADRVRELLEPNLMFDVWINGSGPLSKSKEQIDEIVLMQEERNKYDLFYYHGRSWYMAKGKITAINRKAGDHEKLILWLSQTGEGVKRPIDGEKNFGMSNGSKALQDHRKDLNGVLDKDNKLGWVLNASTCCIKPRSNNP